MVGSRGDGYGNASHFHFRIRHHNASNSTTMSYSSSLTDAEWEISKPLLLQILPRKKRTRPFFDCRVREGIFPDHDENPISNGFYRSSGCRQ
jgi:hypothetical protein